MEETLLDFRKENGTGMKKGRLCHRSPDPPKNLAFVGGPISLLRVSFRWRNMQNIL